ncbi:MAG: peptide ABC transporter substrate-binding protein [Enterococcus faecalis]
MKRLLLFGLLLSVGGLLLGACGTKDKKAIEQQKQIYSRIEPVELASIDVSLATDGYSQTVLNNVNEGLFRSGEKDVPELAGASDVSVSSDGLTYTFELNKQARWSDGKPVTAKDYVYSWQRTVAPETGSEVASLFFPVKNAEQIAQGKMKKEELGVKAVNDYQLVVTLAAPTPYFKSLLTYPTFFPQREDIVEKYGKAYAMTSDKAVYNGPFCLEAYKGPGLSASWTLKKNNNYWDKDSVSLDEIKTQVVKDQGTAYNLFKDNKVDETYVSGEFYIQNKKNTELKEIQQSNSFYIQVNVGNKESIVANKLVREALSYATNREELTDKVLNNGSIPSDNLSPRGMAFSPKNAKDFVDECSVKAEYDKEQSLAKWQESALEKQGKTVELLVSDTGNSKQIGEYLKAQWEAHLPGLTVNVTPLPFSAVLERLQQRNYELVLTGSKPEYPDPTSLLTSLVTNNAQNYSDYSNQQVDQLMNKIQKELGTDIVTRWDKLVEVNDLVMEDLPIIPLLQQRKTYLRNKDIKGVQEHTLGAEFDYKDVKVVKAENGK